MASKQEALGKIIDHVEMLIEYELIDEKTGKTLLCYVYDYVMEIETNPEIKIPQAKDWLYNFDNLRHPKFDDEDKGKNDKDPM